VTAPVQDPARTPSHRTSNSICLAGRISSSACLVGSAVVGRRIVVVRNVLVVCQSDLLICPCIASFTLCGASLLRACRELYNSSHLFIRP